MPYGYRYISKQEGAGQARYEILLEDARVVRQIFTWVGRERCSIGEVCRRLRAQGTASPKGKLYWDRTTVWGILKNPAYRGARRAYSVYDTPQRAIPIVVPALVREELFAAVAEQLAENQRRQRQAKRGARYLLQGLLVCQGCGYAYYGKPVSLRSAKGKKRRYAYYRCTGTDAYRFGGQRVCQNKQVRTDLLEEAVWEDVCALLKDPQRIEAEYERRLQNKDSENVSKGGRQLEVLIQKVRRGIARLIDACSEGLLDKQEFEPRVRAFRERLARLACQGCRRLAEGQSIWRNHGITLLLSTVLRRMMQSVCIGNPPAKGAEHVSERSQRRGTVCSRLRSCELRRYGNGSPRCVACGSSPAEDYPGLGRPWCNYARVAQGGGR